MARRDRNCATAAGATLASASDRSAPGRSSSSRRLSVSSVGVAEEGEQMLGVQPGRKTGQALDVLGDAPEPLLGHRAGRRHARLIRQADGGPDQVGQRAQAPPFPIGRAAHRQHPYPGARVREARRQPPRLSREPGLSEPRLGREHQHPGLAAFDRLDEPVGDQSQFGLPAHERGLVAEARPGAGGVEETEQLVRLDRLPLALEAQRMQPAPGGDVPSGGRGGGTGADRADRGRIRQARRRIHRVTDDRVLQRSLHTGNHLTGVEADAKARRHTAAALVVENAPHRPLHRQRGPDSPFRVVLMCDRSAEHGHDAVAGELVDMTSERPYGTGQGGQPPGRLPRRPAPGRRPRPRP